MTRTDDKYTKCPMCGADLKDEGGVSIAVYVCTECDYEDSSSDGFCDLITSD